MNVNKININQTEPTYYIESDIYDVSAHNNGVTFESLQSLLSSDNLSTLIPTAVRCGGMTIRFVQSSDNTYVQYRLTSTSFSTTENDWQDAAIMGTDRIADGAVTANKLADGAVFPKEILPLFLTQSNLEANGGDVFDEWEHGYLNNGVLVEHESYRTSPFIDYAGDYRQPQYVSFYASPAWSFSNIEIYTKDHEFIRGIQVNGINDIKTLVLLQGYSIRISTKNAPREWYAKSSSLKYVLITTNKLANEAITTNKLANKVVTTDKLADKSVTSEKLADRAVSINKIDNSTKSQINTSSYIFSVPEDYIANGNEITEGWEDGFLNEKGILAESPNYKTTPFIDYNGYYGTPQFVSFTASDNYSLANVCFYDKSTHNFLYSARIDAGASMKTLVLTDGISVRITVPQSKYLRKCIKGNSLIYKPRYAEKAISSLTYEIVNKECATIDVTQKVRENNFAYDTVAGEAPKQNTEYTEKYGIKGKIFDVTGISLFEINSPSGSTCRMWAKVKDGIVIETEDYSSNAIKRTIICDGTFDSLVINLYDAGTALTKTIKKNESVNILFFGNSFTHDSVGYVPYILKNISKEINCTIGIAFIGSSPLMQHLASLTGTNISHGGTIYEPKLYWYSVSKNFEKWDTTYNVDGNDILTKEKWDIIAFQQNGENSYKDFNELFSPYISKLHNYIYGKLGRAIKFGWVLTHASYAADNMTKLHEYWKGTAINAEKVMNYTCSEILFPYGTAVENLRYNWSSDFGGQNNLLAEDDVHLQDGLPALCAAYSYVCVLLKILGFNYKSILGDNINIDKDWVNTYVVGPNFVNGEIMSVDDNTRFIAQISAIQAAKYPFAIKGVLQDKNTFSLNQPTGLKSNQWYGKKVCIIGTSVAFGSEATSAYAKIASERLGFEVIPAGVPGQAIHARIDTEHENILAPLTYGSSCLSKAEYETARNAGATSIVISDTPKPSSGVTWTPSYNDNYNSYYRTWENIFDKEDVSLWIFATGPNNYNFALDDWNVFDTDNWRYKDGSTFEEHRTTFLGAMLYLMDKMYALNNNQRMVLVIDSAFNYDQTKNAFELLHNKWNIPIIDLWAKMNTSPKSLLAIKSKDGTDNHPSTFGQERMGDIFTNELLLIS